MDGTYKVIEQQKLKEICGKNVFAVADELGEAIFNGTEQVCQDFAYIMNDARAKRQCTAEFCKRVADYTEQLCKEGKLGQVVELTQEMEQQFKPWDIE